MKLRVTRQFRDKEAGVSRKVGEVFEASEERARVIIEAGFAKPVRQRKRKG